MIEQNNFSKTINIIDRANKKLNCDFSEEGEIILVDKPIDWTSFDVVKKFRNLFRIKKAGHCGTLDPMATGLLILCTGKKTKIADTFSELNKAYIGTMELGIRTPSHDLETEIIERKPFQDVTQEKAEEIFKTFIGRQKQIPPMYSAVKSEGKPLYKIARKGREVERKEKDIEILKFVLNKFDLPYIGFSVACSKGTYIRTLISDIGYLLGCGATLINLRRTGIGDFKVESALPMEELIEFAAEYRNANKEFYAGH